MSVQARIMAIADIFEALSAADRPYKEPMRLSQVMEIMQQMAHQQHIDKELFQVLVNSGVWLQYADHYLMRQQIDISEFCYQPPKPEISDA